MSVELTPYFLLQEKAAVTTEALEEAQSQWELDPPENDAKMILDAQLSKDTNVDI